MVDRQALDQQQGRAQVAEPGRRAVAQRGQRAEVCHALVERRRRQAERQHVAAGRGVRARPQQVAEQRVLARP